MLQDLTRVLREALRGGTQELRRRAHAKTGGRSFSNLDEEAIIRRWLERIDCSAVPATRTCVDIAASDGIDMSNTFALFRAGWGGLAVEFDAEKFASLARSYVDFERVHLAKCKVTPPTVLALLAANEIPTGFDFLNLDIDSYDYFVLEQLLKEFRPKLICAEVNEKFPPPIKFTVRWDPGHVWAADHFFGQSLSQLDQLAERHDYALVELHYNNAFLVPRELEPGVALTPEEAYRVGYAERPDRREKFPWNADVEALQTLEPEAGLAFVERYFSKYAGRFDATL